jgi:hypothetical protein
MKKASSHNQKINQLNELLLHMILLINLKSQKTKRELALKLKLMTSIVPNLLIKRYSHQKQINNKDQVEINLEIRTKL